MLCSALWEGEESDVGMFAGPLYLIADLPPGDHDSIFFRNPESWSQEPGVAARFGKVQGLKHARDAMTRIRVSNHKYPAFSCLYTFGISRIPRRITRFHGNAPT